MSWIALPIPTDLFTVVFRTSNRGEADLSSHHHIIRTAGAVDDQQLSVGVPSADNTHMGIIRVEHQVTGLCIRPRNIGTMAVLHGGPAAMADYVLSARGIVKHPIHK